MYERSGPMSVNISQQLGAYYLQGNPIEFPKSVEKFAEVYSDSLICFANHRFLQMIGEHVPVYNYLFNYKGRYNYFKLDEALGKYFLLFYHRYYLQVFFICKKGAMHLDELLYFFNSPLLTPTFTAGDPENDTIERLTRLWYEFAKKR